MVAGAGRVRNARDATVTTASSSPDPEKFPNSIQSATTVERRARARSLSPARRRPPVHREASLPSTRLSSGSYGGSSSYALAPQRASPPTGESPPGDASRLLESPAVVTVASRAFYDDNGGVADRLVMRYGPDSVRAHESVAGGTPPSGIEVAIPVAMPVSSSTRSRFIPPGRPRRFHRPFHRPFHRHFHRPFTGTSLSLNARSTRRGWRSSARGSRLGWPLRRPISCPTGPFDTGCFDTGCRNERGDDDSDDERDDSKRRRATNPDGGRFGGRRGETRGGRFDVRGARHGRRGRPPGRLGEKSTAEVRKEETRVALERAALEAGEELSDDSVDDGMDDLDDVDLVSPGWRNGSSASNSKFASSRPGPGLNVGLNVKGVGGYVTGVSSPGPLAAPRRMGGPSQFDDASAPASAAEVRAGIGVRGETNPTTNPTTNPKPDPKPPPLEAARGVVVERAKDGESDPIRDVPNVARGAAILRRLHGPEDGYRSKRESSGTRERTERWASRRMKTYVAVSAHARKEKRRGERTISTTISFASARSRRVTARRSGWRLGRRRFATCAPRSRSCRTRDRRCTPRVCRTRC